MPKYTYNYKKDSIDIRDHKFNLKIPQIKISDLPPKIDLRENTFIPDVLNQGNLGSCTANASSNALRYCLRKQLEPNDYQPSRLYIYYYSRVLENTIEEDSGASLRNVMKAIHTYGTCDEIIWPYDISKFKDRPPLQIVREAQKHVKDFSYLSVNQDIVSIKNALFQGYPIMFGIMVYESLETDEVLKTGDVPLPNIISENFFGGHAILLTGYDDVLKKFTFMNSWGAEVGQKGFFTIPYDYVLNEELAFDFWTINYWK